MHFASCDIFNLERQSIMLKTLICNIDRFGNMKACLIFLICMLVSVTTNASTGVMAQRISAGVFHTVAIKSDGSLWAWGANFSGQLGDGTTTTRQVPKQIGSGYMAIAAGYAHTIALKSDGSLWAWGANFNGHLGDGTTTTSLVPKQIGTGYMAISAGYAHTIALKSDGSL
jgi:alpha-tubulin suppressor-like RCC1 family protein